jgi:hypothetical protein
MDTLICFAWIAPITINVAFVRNKYIMALAENRSITSIIHYCFLLVLYFEFFANYLSFSIFYLFILLYLALDLAATKVK